jgi:tetratricopeptide (TPR) repeat protein
VENFVKRLHTKDLVLRNFEITKRLTSEDGTVKRIKSTFFFQAPPLSQDSPRPSTMKMVLLWVLDDRKWWLERPVSIEFLVDSAEQYPTTAQQELALRFEAALAVLNRIGLTGNRAASLVGRSIPGLAVDDFKELEKLHPQERSAKGIHHTAHGVQVLLRAADHRPAGLLKRYHGDFKTDLDDTRKPVPWDMFRDYVRAAIDYGKSLEKRGSRKKAERVYRRVISLGTQFVDESGGYQFYIWGLTFQKLGAQELARILPQQAHAERQMTEDLVNLTSRRLDLLQTALNCLDDLIDYKSLKAAIIAARSTQSGPFRPWGINTLSILAEKGAPANPSLANKAGAVVLVMNPNMQKKASQALDKLASDSADTVKLFIDLQRQWVKQHRVYGGVQTFQ